MNEHVFNNTKLLLVSRGLIDDEDTTHDAVVKLYIGRIEDEILDMTNRRAVPDRLLRLWAEMSADLFAREAPASNEEVKSISEAGASITLGSAKPDAVITLETQEKIDKQTAQILTHRLPYRF